MKYGIYKCIYKISTLLDLDFGKNYRNMCGRGDICKDNNVWGRIYSLLLQKSVNVSPGGWWTHVSIDNIKLSSIRIYRVGNQNYIRNASIE